MNAIFTAVILLSSVALLLLDPQAFMPAMLGGGEKAIEMSLTLFCVYAVWMSLNVLCEKSGISRGIARCLRPVSKKIFSTNSEIAAQNLAMNLSCNLLGLGGAATPYAVKAIGELEKEGNAFAQKLLFVINATSIQILPTTVIALRAQAGSIASSDIFLPSLICTAVSTALACALFVLGSKLCRS